MLESERVLVCYPKERNYNIVPPLGIKVHDHIGMDIDKKWFMPFSSSDDLIQLQEISLAAPTLLYSYLADLLRSSSCVNNIWSKYQNIIITNNNSVKVTSVRFSLPLPCLTWSTHTLLAASQCSNSLRLCWSPITLRYSIIPIQTKAS